MSYPEKFQSYYKQLNLTSAELVAPVAKYILWSTLNHEMSMWIKFKYTLNREAYKKLKSQLYQDLEQIQFGKILYVNSLFLQKIDAHEDRHDIFRMSKVIQAKRVESSLEILDGLNTWGAEDIGNGVYVGQSDSAALKQFTHAANITINKGIGWLKNRTTLTPI